MIEIDSKWQHKYSKNVVKVIDNMGITNYKTTSDTEFVELPTIVYKSAESKGIELRTRASFLDDFESYEPVYEYQWAIYYESRNMWETLYCWFEEGKSPVYNAPVARMDFTKRERK